MNKFTSFTLAVLTVFSALVFSASAAFAQGMMGNQFSFEDDGHTVQEEQEGKEIWEALRAETVSCDSLTDEDFEALGEYFMGQRLGKVHSAMNAMMEQRMGKEGEELMHEILGKQASGCDTTSDFPSEGNDFLPMMQMMTGNSSGNFRGITGSSGMMSGYGMMGGYGSGWSVLWVITWIALIALVIAGIFWLVRDTQRKK